VPRCSSNSIKKRQGISHRSTLDQPSARTPPRFTTPDEKIYCSRLPPSLNAFMASAGDPRSVARFRKGLKSFQASKPQPGLTSYNRPWTRPTTSRKFSGTTGWRPQPFRLGIGKGGGSCHRRRNATMIIGRPFFCVILIAGTGIILSTDGTSLQTVRSPSVPDMVYLKASQGASLVP